jgi:hypothetical protein
MISVDAFVFHNLVSEPNAQLSDQLWRGLQMEKRKIAYGIISLFALIIVGGGVYFLLNMQSRQLALSDFDFLKPGMTREEIIRKVGEPDRIVGSGLYICQYNLTDGRKIMLSFPNSRDLGGAWIVNKDGTRIDFFGQQP